MYKVKIVFLMMFPLILKSQEIKKEVIFEKNLSWEQIRQKAKKEDKYIFVDHYATWCIPCKQMDRLVYSSHDVINVIEAKFIAVKIQMDSTTIDAEEVKKWYATANSFKKDYKIEAFPTFLFFNPDGRIVHRESGFKMPDDFIKILNEATDEKYQFYTQLSEYYDGVRDYTIMPLLAKNVYKNLRDLNLTFKIADDYNKNYLNKLEKKQLLNRESIEFITWYPKVLRSDDRYFDFFNNNSREVDSIMNQQGFSIGIVDRVITSELINPKLYEQEGLGSQRKIEPHWDRLKAVIQKKYGKERAERNILNAQLDWYTKKKDWKKAARYHVAKIEKVGIDTSFFGRMSINNIVWDVIFEHCNDAKILNKSIKWMEFILSQDSSIASQIDTYANILYKAGRVTDAIRWQKRAIQMDTTDEGFKNRLSKMLMREPTWPTY